MRKPTRTRSKLTHDQHLELIKQHRSNPNSILSVLGEWAKARFQLTKAPWKSTISSLLIRSKSDSFTATRPNIAVAAAATMLDAELILWINKCDKFGVCITWLTIRYKAELLRNALVATGILDPLRALVAAQIIKRLTVHFPETRATEEGRRLIQGITKLYKKHNIFNMDETAVYYCKAPDIIISSNPVSTRKKSKKRMTVAVTTNADASEKLLLLFVGSSRQPRYFNKSSPKQLGVSYSRTSKRWMTRELSRAWVMELDAEIRTKERHILLLLDNVPSHHTYEVLSNVHIQMLHSNTTFVLQPQDAVIIASLQVHIKRKQTDTR